MGPMMSHGLVSAIAIASVLTAMSFFVLWVIRKEESRKLCVFGYASAVFLWIASALLLLCGLFAPAGLPLMGRGEAGFRPPSVCERGMMGFGDHPTMNREMRPPGDASHSMDRPIPGNEKDNPVH